MGFFSQIRIPCESEGPLKAVAKKLNSLSQQYFQDSALDGPSLSQGIRVYRIQDVSA
jgi:hypothetical protein